jgi:type IV secretory pathway VirB10-like protein
MSCAVPNAASERTLASRRALRVAALGIAWAAALAAPAALAQQAFYKWTDKDGKVQYADQPPKNFTGPVTRVEFDAKAEAGALPPVTKASAKGEEATPPAPPDVAAKRRALREKLGAEVTRARENVALAKQALADVGSPGDSERQVIQQRVDKNHPAPGAGSASTGGMFGSGGMHGGAPRSNCRTVKGSDGNTVTTCPTIVPNDAYYERIRKLEEALQKAEEELATAEEAYRRGVD